MSVWLPLRPPSSALFCTRSLPALRTLHVLAARDLRCPPVATTFGSNRLIVPSVRWQSTKEPQNPGPGETRVVTEGASSTTSVAAAKEPLGRRVWKKVKHEAAHYWNGTKLLVQEIRISSRLQWKLLHGESLTRRERRQVCLCLCHCIRDSDE